MCLARGEGVCGSSGLCRYRWCFWRVVEAIAGDGSAQASVALAALAAMAILAVMALGVWFGVDGGGGGVGDMIWRFSGV